MAVVNQKGGVGKTTTAVNLATALAAIGKKVCLIDLDPQGNASTGLGIDRSKRAITSYNLLSQSHSLKEAAQETLVKRLHIVPSTIDLSGAELELVTAQRREFHLQDALSEGKFPYDYIMMDCPPSLGLITINALTACDTVLIPLQCEFYALEGLSHLIKTIRLVQARLNSRLTIHGIALTMYDRRNKLTENIEQDVRSFMGDSVYKTVIPRNVRMSEAPSHGKPALLYDINCSGSRAYASLATRSAKASTPNRCGRHAGSLINSKENKMVSAPKLGKGLSALMADDYSEHSLGDAATGKGLKEIPLDLLCSGQYQPRRHFDERYLQELADSISKNGIMQPLVVRPIEGQEQAKYEIIAGERRWRAAKIAGLYSVPAIIREIDNKQALELALIENVQRQDLTPLEEGEGYQRLMDEFGYTQEELSTTVGKSRSHIANLLRLLHLPAEVKEMISRGDLSMGHARALVGSNNALDVATEVVRRGLNVRQTENLARAGVPRNDRPRPPAT